MTSSGWSQLRYCSMLPTPPYTAVRGIKILTSPELKLQEPLHKLVVTVCAIILGAPALVSVGLVTALCAYHTFMIMTRDSLVDTAMGHELDGPGFYLWLCQRDFCLLHSVYTSCDPYSAGNSFPED
jgi:hypothetical protein